MPEPYVMTDATCPIRGQGQRGASLVALMVSVAILGIMAVVVSNSQGFWAKETRIVSNRGDTNDLVTQRLNSARTAIATKGVGPFLKASFATSQPTAFNPPMDLPLMTPATFTALGINISGCGGSVCSEDSVYDGIPLHIDYTVTLWKYQPGGGATPPIAVPMVPGELLNMVAFIKVRAQAKGVDGVGNHAHDSARIKRNDEIIVAY